MSIGKKLALKVFIAVYLVVMVLMLVLGNWKKDLKASSMALFQTVEADGASRVKLEQGKPVLAPNLRELKSVYLAKDYRHGDVFVQEGTGLEAAVPKLAEAVNAGGANQVWVTGEKNVVGFDLTLILIALNFLGLLGILYLLLWEPILNALDNRAQTVQTELETARTARSQADDLLAKYNAQLDEARQQRQKLIRDGRDEGQKERERIVAEARAEAAHVLEHGRSEIETERAAAAAALKRDLGGLAVDLAEQILRREVNEADQDQLVASFLGDLEKQPR